MTKAWTETTVGEWCPFAYGKGLPERDRRGGSVPVFGSNGVVGWHDEFAVNGAGIIIGRKGTVGSVILSGTPFWPIDTTFYVGEADHRDLRFTAALLQSLGLDQRNSHSAVPGLSRDDAHQLLIRVPSLDEQRRIAHVLSALDERIEVTSRLIDLLSAAAQTLSETAPSTCSVSDLARTERVQWYPEQHLGDIVDHYSLPAFDAGTGAERVEASAIASNKLQVRGPSVLFSRLNPDTNRTWLCTPSSEVSASVCSTEYAVLVAETTTASQLWAVLSSGEVGGLLAAASTGTSASHQRVREDAVLGAAVPDPRSLSRRDQQTIDIYAKSVLDKIRELKVLRDTRDLLLPSLVSGELRVALL